MLQEPGKTRAFGRTIRRFCLFKEKKRLSRTNERCVAESLLEEQKNIFGRLLDGKDSKELNCERCHLESQGSGPVGCSGTCPAVGTPELRSKDFTHSARKTPIRFVLKSVLYFNLHDPLEALRLRGSHLSPRLPSQCSRGATRRGVWRRRSRPRGATTPEGPGHRKHQNA